MESRLAQLLSPLPHVVQQGVEEIMNEAQVHRKQLLDALLRDTRCSQYLTTLGKLLLASDLRLCSSVAFILGTVAEDPTICTLLVDLAEHSTDWDLLGRLSSMLLWEDMEAVMNAAGALGTLAEHSQGRQWILAFPNSNAIIENIADLLESPSDWTASNCALVLARICMCQKGCNRILDHPKSDGVLRKLIASLHVDEAGCGLNAAFALGRLCDTDTGRKRVLGLREAEDMVSALEEIMSGEDAGGSRNACFAIACLATDQAGHEYVLKNPSFPQIVDTLCCLLQSEEQESSWFAAMTVKVLSSYSHGVVRLRQHHLLEKTLKRILASHMTGKDLLEEVQTTLKNLQRLPQPSCPRAKVTESRSIWIDWEEYKPNSGLPVTYSLFDGERLLYRGTSCSYQITDSKAGHQYHLKVVMETPGDRSPDSPVTVMTMDEPLPGPPMDLHITGRTATKIKLNWSPPSEASTLIKGYIVYKEDSPVETTSELSCIVGGLLPLSSYNFSVCAFSSRGQGQKSSIAAKTMDKGDHAPGKLTLYVIGRSEIFITWEVPRDSAGKFFNYELCMNGKPVYLGTERSYTARRLIPNTEYTCRVCAITSEGRFESRPVTKRTAKDEYSNLSKNHVTAESNQLLISSPPRDSHNPTQRQKKTDGPAKNCPDKSHHIRLLLSRQTSKTNDKTSQAPNSRRGSQISWSTESSDDNIGTLEFQKASTCDPAARHMEEAPQRRKGNFSQKEIGTSKETPQTINTGASPKPSQQLAVKATDDKCPKPAHPGSDNKKPQSAYGLRLLPVASLQSLVPEHFLLHQTKMEAELLQSTFGHKQEQKIHECPPTSDKEKSLCRRKTLQPLKDPTLRFRHQNLRVSAWDITGALKSGERRRHSFSGRSSQTSSEEEKIQPVTISFLCKDRLFSKPGGKTYNNTNIVLTEEVDDSKWIYRSIICMLRQVILYQSYSE
ncbi:hypothetical protein XELAEV_18041469mg [Pelobates cultripes]|uniref:Fibronectin type-III domain-containing protein n=1 Tax=Pelobates cultripes TaxID=61616 RepID=A0AAD1T249_PELCU|nr:hypothetical protein XELAEV_18041469mg [Pelobates cultripes]